MQSLEDLKGKTIGVGALTNGNVPIIRSMFAELGLSDETDYSIMAIGDGPVAYRATLNGDVAAYNGNDVFMAMFGQIADIHRLPVPDKYRSLFSNGFVAHSDTLKERSDVLARFGRAVTKGTLACEADLEACVQGFWEYRPELKPNPVPSSEDIENAKAVLGARMSKYLYFGADGERVFGRYEPAAWDQYVELLYGGGQLKTKEIDISSVYTNALVEEFNR